MFGKITYELEMLISKRSINVLTEKNLNIYCIQLAQRIVSAPQESSLTCVDILVY